MSKPKNNNSKKVLCVCRGGNSRSVGAAYTLKYAFGHDAIAIGFEGNSKETLNMLCEWADYILVMKSDFIKEIDAKHIKKIHCCDVGHDRYFQIHNDLINQVENFAQNKEEFKIK